MLLCINIYISKVTLVILLFSTYCLLFHFFISLIFKTTNYVFVSEIFHVYHFFD